MGKRPFVRFYHQDWYADGDVNRMSMEEIGTYFSLLVRQMIDGYVPTNPADFHRDLHATPEEAERLFTPKIAEKFKKFEDNPAKMYNARLKEVVEETDLARAKGFNNSGKRWERPVSASGSLEASLEDAPVFDFGPIIRAMPKRRVNNRYEGWEAGVECLKFITTQEEYDTKLEAVRNYAKTRKGQDPSMHYRFDNFINSKYKEFLSKETASRQDTDTPPKEKPIEVVEAYENTDAKIKALRSKGITIQAPPWDPRNADDDAERNELATRWTEDKRSAWLTKYMENPNG